MIRLEDYLVLNRYSHSLLGADSFDELKSLLALVDEGPGSDGQSNFFARLAAQAELEAEKLRTYDGRVMQYEARLAEARSEFKGFRYFQYLALLYTEMMLDRLTDDPALLLAELNAFLAKLRSQESHLRDFPDFAPEDLRRLAFFMATGSGKTLLLHANVWQVLYYLEHGKRPDGLVDRADGRREFDNILLVTPNEGLSYQHIQEFHASSIHAGLFIEDPHGRGDLFGPKVKVIEISKLAEEPSREGVSVVLDELGDCNLVFVDEGHKGTGSEARVWKSRQHRLSRDGFLFEYSATFAQAIGAASRRAQGELLAEYGKAILFDYSYAHFYGDGYGKNFRVLNLSRARANQAHELLVGGLLTYYHQFELFQKNAHSYRPYNVERPLWVMLGSSVNAMFTRDGQRRSDVAEVVAFLRHFVEDEEWAVGIIGRVLAGNSGFTEGQSGPDLFAPHIEHLRGRSPNAVYRRILKHVFHGAGALEVWELKNAEGELALRVSAGAGKECPHFGVINIGDVSTFKKYLREQLGIEVQEDRFAGSQFDDVNRPDSATNVLIGAKKFIEGWSSWRVSSMGLLNVGRGEGPQVIQLFGRGVRLKGKDMGLKRTEALPESNGHPDGIGHLETLYLFGWNADYIRTFRDMLEREDVGKEFTIPVEHYTPWPQDDLPVPETEPDFDFDSLTWTLCAEPPRLTLDVVPRLAALSGARDGAVVATGQAGAVVELSFAEPKYAGLLDQDKLFTDLLAYKRARGYHNVFVPRAAVMSVLQDSCRLRMLSSEARVPAFVHEAASQLLKTYLDRYVRRKEREAESQHVIPGRLDRDDRVVSQYRVRVKKDGFLPQIERLLKKPLKELDDGEPLPRFYVDWHLFKPILAEGGRNWKKYVSVRPAALVESERQLIQDIKAFWASYHDQPPYAEYNVYLLRNLPRAGVGLFHRSGFYPDFIIWLKNTTTGAIHIRFMEPHGLHHGGLGGSEDKFQALRKLAELSQHPDFKAQQITLDGFLISSTDIEQIPDADGRSWPDLEAEFPLLRQQADYAKRLLDVMPSGSAAIV